MNFKRRCAKCKRDKDEVQFQQLGWCIDRVTPRFSSYCYPCRRLMDRKRYHDPVFKLNKKIKRKLYYEATGK